MMMFRPSLLVFAVILMHSELAQAQRPDERGVISAELAGVLDEAREARASGDLERAASLASQAAEELTGRTQGHALLLRGLSLLEAGQFEESEAALAEAQVLLSNLADRISLMRGEALFNAGEFESSRDMYSAAKTGAAVDLLAMRADLGLVMAMLEAGDRRNIQRASQLLIRYPSLPERQDVEFGIARAFERRGQKAAAYVRYRKLWLEHPFTHAGDRAGERLEALAASGFRVARVKHTEHLDRARRLMSEREYDGAERELLETLHVSKGSVQLHLQLELAVLSVRRGELDRARELLLELQEQRGPTGPWVERCEILSGNTRSAVRRTLKGRAPTKRTPPGQLVRAAEVHLDAGEYQKARNLLSFVKMARARGFMGRWLPWIAFKLGEHDKALPAFARLREERWSRGRRSYWVGRAQHKAHRPCEARVAYEAALAAAPHGYYGLWARKRLGELRDEVREQLSTDDAEPLLCPAPTEEAPDATVAWSDPNPLMNWNLGPRKQAQPTLEQGLDAFQELITAHGAALPWLERARDLWLAGDVDGAGEELNQAYSASRGQLIPKTGLQQVWGGRPKIRLPGRRRPARFSEAQVDTYRQIAYAIGEPGLSIRADRPDWSDIEAWHPVAFEPEVRSTANRHELPPELIWSIMRIESYFNRHAISHANAIGLMQILPRTGRRVARRTNVDDFEVADLLSPRRGLEFSAWYLAALSDRFHGQTPLMIASYNGGPHNVAKWIMRRSDTDRPLPMDEFLEEIPFSETYRYVRRVLGSMAVYHALAGLPPPELPAVVDRDVARGVNF